MDKDTVLTIFNFLSKYKSILHLSDELLDKVREIVQSKYDNVEIYKLNPSIDDLLDCNFYKLYIENQLYLVPLWHYETCYDGSGCEIIVICEPELPEGVKIDDDNNLYIETKISIYNVPNMLMNNYDIPINIGHKHYFIPLSNLYLKKEQYYRLKNEGITKAKSDIYDVNDKSDIIIKIGFF